MLGRESSGVPDFVHDAADTGLTIAMAEGARSLNVALQTRSGPASAATVRAIEDAILTRARQLRVADNRL